MSERDDVLLDRQFGLGYRAGAIAALKDPERMERGLLNAERMILEGLRLIKREGAVTQDKRGNQK